MKYKDTDYLHASTRVTYLSNQLITREDLLKAIDADSFQEAGRVLSGKGMFADGFDDDYEAAFERTLAEDYSLIEEITGEQGVTHVFRYPVDGHNLKVIIKNQMADGDFLNLLKSGGTVDTETLQREFMAKDFYQVPESLGRAALEASETLAKTRDSQAVDIIMDKAVIALMGEKAREIDCQALTEYVMTRIDLINARAAVRMLKMKKNSISAAKVFAEGGNFTIKELDEAYTMGFDGMIKLLERTPAGSEMVQAVASIRDGGSISVFEQQEDKCFRALFDKTRIVPFGIEPVITYLYLKEQEVRACRLVLVSKFYNIDKNVITERLRCVYAD